MNTCIRRLESAIGFELLFFCLLIGMDPINIPAQELLPHRKRMLLVERAVGFSPEVIRTESVIRPDNLFLIDSMLPAWCLLEYMAQTMAMWVHLNARKNNQKPPVGFLLGTRRLNLNVDAIGVGSRLVCEAQPLLISEEGLAQFQCRALLNDQEVATARINAFEPQDLAGFLKDLS